MGVWGSLLIIAESWFGVDGGKFTISGAGSLSPGAGRKASSYEKGIKLKLSGNEVYYTACS